MALQKLQFKAGINQDVTNYSNEGGWFECDKVRFLNGYPEKIKGWEQNGTYTLDGTCRALFGWVTSFTDNFLAIGTNSKVYIDVGENLNDITPIRATSEANNIFAATDGSSTIVVTSSSHGAVTGDFVTFSGAVSLGGNITAAALNQNYEITKIDSNSYSISARDTDNNTVTANSSDSGNGGTSTVQTFEITAGNGTVEYGYGWGTSTWGRLTWGSGSLQPVILPLTVWFFDNFDNDLIMNVNTDGKGAIYYWARGSVVDPTNVISTRAVLLSSRSNASDVPAEVGQIMVSQVDRHLLAFGATPFGGGTFDPLLIRFSNQDEPENFTPSTLNSAGFIKVSSGSRIVTAFRTRQEILIFTDMSVHSLQFLGTTDVFGLQELEANISIASPRCVAGASNILFWMGADKFYMYNGKVDTLPCTLRDFVFNNINFDALAYVYAGTVEAQSEVWWFYPSKNSSTNDSYIVYNYNEVGNDADGSAMSAFITSSDFDIGDGDKFTLVNRIIPDVSFTGSNASEPTVKMTVKPRNFPGSTYSVEQDKNVIETDINVYTEQVFLRARARQMGFKISSDTLGTTWKLGSPRLDGRPDGRR